MTESSSEILDIIDSSTSAILSRAETEPSTPTIATQLEKQNLRLKARIVTLENKMTELLSDGKIDDAKIDEYIKSIRDFDEINAKLNESQIQLNSANEIIAKQKETISQMDSTEIELKREIAELKSRITVIQSRNGGASPESMKSLQQYKLDNSKLKQEISGLESTNAELTVQILSLQSKLKDIDNDENRTGSEFSRLKATISDLQSKLKVMNSENNSLKQEINSFKSKIEAMETHRMSKERESENLRRNVQSNQLLLKNAAETVLSRASHLQNRFDQLSADIAEKTGNAKSRLQQTAHKTTTDASERLSLFRSASKHQLRASNTAVAKLSSLIATIVDLPSPEVPNADIITNDAAAMDYFIDQIETAFAMKDSKNKMQIKNYEEELKRLEKLKKRQVLSQDILNAVQNVQDRMAESTRRLQNEHKAFLKDISLQNSK